MSALDTMPGRMRSLAGFLAPRRSVREISQELAALKRHEEATRADPAAWQPVMDHGSDLGLELIASFERETGVDFNLIRGFL